MPSADRKDSTGWEDTQIDPQAVVVFITAYGDAEKAVKAIKSGATDFVLKPWQNEKLLATVSSSVKLRRSRLEADELRIQAKGNECGNGSAFY